MGSEIAFLGAAAGDTVRVFDSVDGAAERGCERARAIIARRVEKGRIPADEADAIAARLRPVGTIAGLSECDTVIEAVSEQMEIKAAVFWDLNRALGSETLIASNTSGLSISELAAITDRPERVVGMHFFNPASVMPLVEVIAGGESSDVALEAAAELARRYGKTPIRVRECPGFLVNRILVRAMLAAYRATEELDAAPGAVDAAIAEIGPAPMGPYALGDLVGLDTLLGISQQLEGAYGAAFAQGARLPALVAAGSLGAKSGTGFDPAEAPDTPQARRAAAEYYRAAVAEAEACEREQIATRSDIDTAMCLGAGWEEGPLDWSAADRAVAVLDPGAAT